MLRNNPVVLLFLLVVFAGNILFAKWEITIGPTGGAVSHIEKISSQLAIVTIYGGSYFSSNNGGGWIERIGLTYSFAPRLTNRGNQYLAATEAGVFLPLTNIFKFSGLLNLELFLGNLF